MSRQEQEARSGAESDAAESDFAKMAHTESPGIVREFVDFLSENKKWWLFPIVVVLLLIGVLIVLGGTGLAPFIYTLF